MAKGDRTYCLM